MVPSDGLMSSSIVGSRRSSTQRNKAVKMIPSQRQIERLDQMKIFNYGYDDDQGDYKT
jgi:hypothetical protein